MTKKIIFAPGCFDNFEGTQEELEEFMTEITKAVESGEFEENSFPVDGDEFNELDEDLQEKLIDSLRSISEDGTVPSRNKRLN
jgi:hypothetical protein